MKVLNFLGLFIRKTFQILLSLLIVFLFVIYLLTLYSCIDITFWCTFKNEPQNYLFTSVYSLIMIFILSFCCKNYLSTIEICIHHILIYIYCL